MKRRNTKIHEFNPGQGTKILCSKFGNKSKGVLVSGDDKNNVSLWKISKDKPLMTLNHSGSSSTAQVDVTSVNFSISDCEVFSGSNRGIINIWDINAQKLQTTLKGHTVGISTLNIFPMEEAKHLLVSGSYDTNVKVWDYRSKSAFQTFKGHTMQVNSVACSPDGKLIISGSSDGTVKLWDLTSGKCMHTFMLHDSPVNCVQFNPSDMAFASGGSDKTVKYWDLETFQLISSTKPEATPIQQMLFSDCGKCLFSAAHESMKVWNLENNGMLMDNVESQWRGVQDIGISDIDDMVLGLSATSSQFSIWACPLKLINMSEEYAPRQNPNIYSRQGNNNQNVVQSQPPQLFKKGSYAQNYQQQQQQQQFQSQYQPGQQYYDQQQQNPYQYQQQYQQNQEMQNQPQQQQQQQQQYNQQLDEAMAQIQKVNLQMNNLDQQMPTNHVLQQKQQELQQQLQEQQEQLANTQQKLDLQLKQKQILELQKKQSSLREELENQKNLPDSNQQQNSEIEEQIDADSLEEFDVKIKNKNSSIKEEDIIEKQINQNNQMQLSMLQDQYHQNNSAKKNNNAQQNTDEALIDEDVQEKQQVDEEKLKQRESQLISGQNRQQQQQQQKQQEPQQIDNQMDQSTLTIIEGGGNFSISSVYQEQDREKYLQMDVIHDTLKEHQKFHTILQSRANYMKPILHWWTQGNIKSALHAINQLTDTSLLMDALQMCLNINKLQYLNIEGVSLLISKSKLLIESKYSPHMECGLDFSYQMLKQYKDEIIQIKTFSIMKGVDIAREQRIQKYDILIDNFRQIYNLPRLKKIVDKGQKQLGDMGKRLKIELDYLFTKIDVQQ